MTAQQTGSQHPFTDEQKPVTYILVKKQTYATTTCKKCLGVGCKFCHDGKTRACHTTEIDLVTALKEIGF